MLLLLSVLFGLFGAGLTLDRLLYTGEIARMFPDYLPTLVPLAGLIVAGLVYSDLKKRKKPKKQRRGAVFAAVLCLIACLFATGSWLYRIYFIG